MSARPLPEMEELLRILDACGAMLDTRIGVVLWEIIRGCYHAQAGAVLIIIVVSVTAIDFCSAYLRKRFI